LCFAPPFFATTKTVAHNVRLYFFQNSFKFIIDKSSYSSIVSNLGNWKTEPTVTHTADISLSKLPLFASFLTRRKSRAGFRNVVFLKCLKVSDNGQVQKKDIVAVSYSLTQRPTGLNCWYHCSCSNLPLLLEIPKYLLISNYHSCLHGICLNPRPIPSIQFHQFYSVLLSTPLFWSEFVTHVFESIRHSNSEKTALKFYKAVKLLDFIREVLCFEISVKIHTNLTEVLAVVSSLSRQILR
jgi:hypothetical protein